MAFKRMEGFAGSVPQKFADQRIPKCPMCGTNNPHWSIDERMGKMFSFDPEENAHKYLFKLSSVDVFFVFRLLMSLVLVVQRHYHGKALQKRCTEKKQVQFM